MIENKEIIKKDLKNNSLEVKVIKIDSKEMQEGKPKGSRGRPAISNGDDGKGEAAVIAVNIDGHVITWSNGSWAGDGGLIKEAKCKSDAGVMVSLSYLGKIVIANEDNLLGALACMVAINPGRARILSAPESVNSYLFPMEGIL